MELRKKWDKSFWSLVYFGHVDKDVGFLYDPVKPSFTLALLAMRFDVSNRMISTSYCWQLHCSNWCDVDFAVPHQFEKVVHVLLLAISGATWSCTDVFKVALTFGFEIVRSLRTWTKAEPCSYNGLDVRISDPLHHRWVMCPCYLQ